MNRPPLRVADVFRSSWTSYRDHHPVATHTAKVVRHILTCRTASLGGHLHRCDTCGKEVPLYNSCRDRHCPTCQTVRKQQWIEKRRAELLPVPYFHVVFTLPHALNALAASNRPQLLRELFSAVNWVLQHFAADPQWKLQGQLGFIAVLHTWSQRLMRHDHVHCLVPGGAWNPGTRLWRTAHRNFLFGKQALSKAFQARLIRRLQHLRRHGKLLFEHEASAFASDSGWNALIQSLWQTPWVVYPKATARNPEQALDYLARYTHRVAISNHRLLTLAQGHVTFSWRDRSDQNRLKSLVLPADQFIGRFLLHILPHGFAKVRAFGWLAGRTKTATLAAIRTALGAQPPSSPPTDETSAQRILRLTGLDVTACPFCKTGHLVFILSLPPVRDGPS
jgi:hypothetical protein